MKTEYTEGYYRSIWNEMMNGRGARHYMNFEEDLEALMKPYSQHGFPEQAFEVIRKEMAKRVCSAAKEDLLKIRETVLALRSGNASLGNVSMRDEIVGRHELIQRFEFNCLQLADFKKKYNL